MLWQRRRNRQKIDSCVWQRDDFDSECYASEKDKSELTAVTHENAGMIDSFYRYDKLHLQTDELSITLVIPRKSLHLLSLVCRHGQM